MTEVHMAKRVNCGLYLLEKHGFVVSPTSDYARMVITDESSGIGINGKLNTKQDRVWSKSVDAAGTLLDFQVEKFDSQFMVWG